MPSSTSSSDGGGPADVDRWRGFFLVGLLTTLGTAAAIYAFVALVDPWNVLPLSPTVSRALVTSNQRFAYGALTREPRFDSLVVGTSTSRLLRPPQLDTKLGGRFVNLSMNAATPYEQSRLLDTFRRSHPAIRWLLLGINFFQWCDADREPARYMALAFPEWMYGPSRWSGYAQIFTLYAVQEATAQVGAWLGIRPPRFDPDGYANFLPEDSLYDAERAAANLPPPLPHPRPDDEPRDRADLRFPTLTRMRDMLSSLPEGTRKLVFFAPIYLGSRPPPGEPSSETLAACKARVVAIARTVPNTSVVDFTIDSPITRVPTNYWDPLHYRIGIAGQLEADLGQAARDPAALSDDYRILLP